MSVTFRPSPTRESERELGHHLACTAHPCQDLREFASYDLAVAGIAEHNRHCRDQYCTPDAVYPVTRRVGDSEPDLNVSSSNAMVVLRALGFLPEIGADDVHVQSLDEEDIGPAPVPGDADGEDPRCGQCPAEDMLGRVDLALALAPADAGMPSRDLNTAGTVIDCGRRPGYLQDRLHALRAVAVFAHERGRDVWWS
ncbi:hypothetical protein [Pseudonocardia sp. KRD291]|uniref:hypothetical protein n=1 Tax=Pseudonocardia sp. KRD291 TaxID=2792007 RepID=UPI001C4A1025|nr:hypothetical protein [Pseudonocardia sp. KRD291]MBW0101529.1 hypothetical protein [Pseudonocardia sp. KRD291]